MTLRSFTLFFLRIFVSFVFNKTISLFYSLFVFRLCYKIIGLSSLNCRLTHLWPTGMDRAWNLQAGPGLGQTFHICVGPGPGLNSSLRAWAGPGLKNYCGPGL